MREIDLVYFKKILNERKTQIKKNISDAAKEMESLNDSEANDEIDHATISTDRSIEQAITSQQSHELKNIEYALNKIKNGTYGICEMCEEDINIQRLKVKPHAKYCIVCRELIEKDSKNKRI